MPRRYLPTLLALLCLVVCSCNGEQTTCSSADGTCQNNEEDPNCKDLSDKCLEWAEKGECTTNPAFMNKTCRQSCEVCASTRVPDWETADDCEDLHPKCSEWAGVGECVGNPGYMSVGCRRACYQCMNVKREREEGLDEEEILKRYRFLHGNWGETQSLGGEGDQTKTKEIMILMMKYALNNVTTYPLKERLVCKNANPSCAFWAASGECENNLGFMINECALACQFCDQKLKFEECRVTESDVADPWVQPGALKTKFEYLKTLPNAKLVSQVEFTDHNHPWVLKFDNFLSAEESDMLLAFAKELEWNASAPIFVGSFKEISMARRESTSAFCKSNCNAESYSKLKKKLLDLVQAEAANMEQPMEFVHYAKYKSFAMHHDFRLHDVWMPAGPRVLSIFLCLTDVPEGGAMGFPNLDWLSVPAKKGQLLVWPNVLSSDPRKIHKDMMSETLPVLKGEKYGVHAWIRLYDYNKAEKTGCV